MNYLLDTHILLWTLFDNARLSEKVKKVISNPLNSIFVSSIDFWEISIKYRTGKILLGNTLPEELPAKCLEMDFQILELNEFDTSSFYQLNVVHHKDPFDRMLIWQAIKNDYTLISDDENVKKYAPEGLKVIF